MRGGSEFPPVAEGSKGSEAARAPGPFPCAIVGWAVLPLPAGCTCAGASPFWKRYPRPLEEVVCSQIMFRAGFLANCCCRCEGEFEDKIKGSAECLGLFDVLVRNNYPAQPLLPSCSLQSTRRSGRTKGKGRTRLYSAQPFSQLHTKLVCSSSH